MKRSLEEGYSDNTGIFQNLAGARGKRRERGDSSNRGNSLLESMEIWIGTALEEGVGDRKPKIGKGVKHKSRKNTELEVSNKWLFLVALPQVLWHWASPLISLGFSFPIFEAKGLAMCLWHAVIIWTMIQKQSMRSGLQVQRRGGLP